MLQDPPVSSHPQQTPKSAGVVIPPGHSMDESKHSKHIGLTDGSPIKQSDQLWKPQQSGCPLAETWMPVLIQPPPL